MVKIIDKLIDNMQGTFDSVGIHRMVRFCFLRETLIMSIIFVQVVLDITL